ncbi:MAG: hypothetical protein ACLRIL_11490 [Fusicatenibacter saccharivorans]
MKKKEKQLHADHESGAELSLCGIPEAHCFPCARRDSTGEGGKVLLVTSVAENEGKSTLAANLALALSEEQNRVLLLDCDFRQPALYKIFETSAKGRKGFRTGSQLGKESASSVFEKYKDTNVYMGICRESAGGTVGSSRR